MVQKETSTCNHQKNEEAAGNMKPEIIKIKNLQPAESQLVIDIDKDFLFTHFNQILENKHAYYAVAENDVIYRVRKKPEFIKANTIIHNPQISKIETSLKSLLEIQRKHDIDIYETEDCFCILLPSLIWVNYKEKTRETR
jgi:hypothetical protein